MATRGKGRQGDILAKAIPCSLFLSTLESPDPSPAAAVPSHRARAQLVTLCSRKLKKKKKNPPGPKIGSRLVSGGGSGLGGGNCMHLHRQASPQV